jgi:outer membrane immunogenic protein
MGMAAALVLSASSAGADGMRYSAPVQYDSWSGAYVGVNAGWGWSDTEWHVPTGLLINRFDASADGAVYGGHVGVQKQWGALVAGVELSFDGSSMKNEKFAGPSVLNTQFTTQVNDLFTAVGRLGFTTGPWLIYGKGGWADGEVQLSAITGGLVLPGIVFSVSERLDGPTVGGGVEWKLSRNFILGVEYNFVELRSHTFNTSTTGTVSGVPVNIHLDDVNVSTVMARLSYKFDDRAPTAPLK